MVKLFLSLSILVLGLLQVTLLHVFNVFSLKPDLLLIAAVFVSLSLDFKTALIFCLFAGLVKDAFSAHSFGINIVLFALWCLAITQLSRKIPLDYYIIRIALIAAIAIMHNIISAAFLVSGGEFISAGIILRSVIIGSLYTTGVAALVFKIDKLPLIL